MHKADRMNRELWQTMAECARLEEELMILTEKREDDPVTLARWAAEELLEEEEAQPRNDAERKYLGIRTSILRTWNRGRNTNIQAGPGRESPLSRSDPLVRAGQKPKSV